MPRRRLRRRCHKLRTEADNHSRNLYGNNQAVYNLLRYGVPVKIEAGEVTRTVHLINWREPLKNDFTIAEEVTLKGNHERRPDLVLYVNGIAVGVLELKSSRNSIGEGIRQNLSNQQPEFNAWFFSTVQLIFAGNDSEGLRYGTIGMPLLLERWQPLMGVRPKEPTHNARFVALMDRFMPKWQFHRQVLNRLPVRREHWRY